MQMQFRRMLVATLLLLSLANRAADFETPLMGPLLGFKGTNPETHSWHVSALYLLREASVYPKLSVTALGLKTDVTGQVIGKQLGYSFVRYDMMLSQAKEEMAVSYQLPGQTEEHFYVPALGHAADKNKFVYHSCNGYQTVADRDLVQGIAPAWKVINENHEKNHFYIQIGGGDLYYADGLDYNKKTGWTTPTDGTAHGIFALPIIKEWLANRETRDTAPFTKEMKAAVWQFYFNQIVAHFNEDEFQLANRRIPAIYQYDDHDIHDGAGSYPKALQESPVLSGIRDIGRWFVFTVQHQLSKSEFPRDESGIRGYNYVHVFDKLAIAGVDTRTERSEDKIVSDKSLDNVFSRLEELSPEVEHVIILLSVPVVYASSNALESAVNVASSLPIIGGLLNHIPGFKNSFGLFELADDGRDGWGHYSHKDERDNLILRLQEYARRTMRRVTIVGGDVHLGGAGKIYPNDCGFEDCSDSSIYQAISSPVGNAPVSKKAAKAIGLKACHGEYLAGECSMCCFKLEREDGGKQSSLISARNFLMFGIDDDLSMKMRWSAELDGPGQPHTMYHLNIPRSESRKGY